MRNIGRKRRFLAAALPVAALIACSSDSKISPDSGSGKSLSSAAGGVSSSAGSDVQVLKVEPTMLLSPRPVRWTTNPVPRVA